MKKIILTILMLSFFPSTTVTHTHPVSIVPKPKPFKRISEKEVTCLAKNIYYEAPAESYEGKLAVATVTMNRVRSRSFPKTICGVVYQRNKSGCQFSWTCGARAKFNKSLYNRAYAVAKQVLTSNVRHDKLKNALYFHNTAVAPNWTFAKRVIQIDNHIFYEPKKVRSRRT